MSRRAALLLSATSVGVSLQALARPGLMVLAMRRTDHECSRQRSVVFWQACLSFGAWPRLVVGIVSIQRSATNLGINEVLTMVFSMRIISIVIR